MPPKRTKTTGEDVVLTAANVSIIFAALSSAEFAVNWPAVLAETGFTQTGSGGRALNTALKKVGYIYKDKMFKKLDENATTATSAAATKIAATDAAAPSNKKASAKKAPAKKGNAKKRKLDDTKEDSDEAAETKDEEASENDDTSDSP